MSSRMITVVDSDGSTRFMPPKPGLDAWWSITIRRSDAAAIAGASRPVRSSEAQSVVTTRPSSGSSSPRMTSSTPGMVARFSGHGARCPIRTSTVTPRVRRASASAEADPTASASGRMCVTTCTASAAFRRSATAVKSPSPGAKRYPIYSSLVLYGSASPAGFAFFFSSASSSSRARARASSSSMRADTSGTVSSSKLSVGVNRTPSSSPMILRSWPRARCSASAAWSRSGSSSISAPRTV